MVSLKGLQDKDEPVWSLSLHKNEEEGGYGDLINKTVFGFTPLMEDIFLSIKQMIEEYEEKPDANSSSKNTK